MRVGMSRMLRRQFLATLASSSVRYCFWFSMSSDDRSSFIAIEPSQSRLFCSTVSTIWTVRLWLRL
jgi:hypothetical protein